MVCVAIRASLFAGIVGDPAARPLAPHQNATQKAIARVASVLLHDFLFQLPCAGPGHCPAAFLTNFPSFFFRLALHLFGVVSRRWRREGDAETVSGAGVTLDARTGSEGLLRYRITYLNVVK